MIENNLVKQKYFKFLEDYTDENKRDTNRERTYAVNQFISFLESQEIPISKLDSQAMFDYVRFLRNRKLKNNKRYSSYTISQRFALVRTFLKYCYEKRFIDTHVDRIITTEVKHQLPSKRKKIKQYITIEEMKELLNKADKEHRALLRVMYNSAARVSAISNIKISDIDFREKTLLIYERKKNNENIITLADSTIKAIEVYISRYRKDLKDSSVDYLFVSKFFTQLSIRSIQRIVREQSLKVLGKQLTPHRFRDIAITHMLENNASVADVALIASHANVTTTMGYYEQSRKHRKDVMNKAHPLNQSQFLQQKEQELSKKEEEIEEARKDLDTISDSLNRVMKKIKKQQSE